MKPDFQAHFNDRKQWVDVYLEANCEDWGSFLATWKDKNFGVFGELRIYKPEIRLDTVVHEIIHIISEYASANEFPIEKDEEGYANMADEIFREIETELKRLGLI